MLMSFDHDKLEDSSIESTVFYSAMKDKQMGVAIWDMKNNTFELMEQITDYPADSFKSLPDFIDIVALEKDRRMAHCDLQDYLDEKHDMFRTTFRIQTKDGQYKWMLLKGRIANNDRVDEQRFDLLLYDVSGQNYLSGNDEETNLLNRNYFIRKLKQFYEDTGPNDKSAVIGINISNFQPILDVYGYQISADVIKEVSVVLNDLFGENSEIASFSSENFVVLLYNGQNVEPLVNQVIETFKQPLLINNQLIPVEVNLGVTLSPEHSVDAIELLLFVEAATLQARQLGTYQTVYFDKKLSKSIHQRFQIKTELREAIEKNEFYLLYQPQVDATTKKVIGVEALIRWKNEKLGYVSPNIFIPIAEKRGHMIELGLFILEESIRTASIWRNKGYNFGSISINISPMELTSGSYVETILQLCEKYDVPKSLLKLEITEGVYVESMKNSLETVRKLVDNGFAISVDDFGTGYSNLAFLSKARIETLKIDKSLIDSIYDETGKFIVKTIVDLGRTLHYKVLAEGVETEEQVHILSEMGCHLIQGYYYSSPKTRDEIEAVFKNNNQL